jgi:BASS family bile acid:Na+ symporter
VQAVLNLGIPGITFLILLAVGLDLTPGDFARVRHQHRIVAAGLVGPLLLLPPLALVLILVFSPTTDIRAGLLLVVACPIGGISNLYTYLARAATALSVTLTAFSSVLAILTIPLLDIVFGAVSGHRMGLTAPLPLIVGQLLVMLGLPVALGMWARFSLPALAGRSQRYLRAVGVGGIVALIVLIVASDPVGFVNGLAGTVPLAATFVAASFLAGWLVGGVTGASPSDRFTLATEFATRNIAVAAAIAVTLAGRVEFALFATTYFLTEAPLMLGAIIVFRRWPPALLPTSTDAQRDASV